MAITHCMYFQAGFLKCHPDQFAHDPYTKYAAWIDKFLLIVCHNYQFPKYEYLIIRLNIDGRNSFITGFGRCLYHLWLNRPIKKCNILISSSIHSIAHPLSLNGLAPWGSKRVCRASPYSPSTPGNVPFRCRLPFHSSYFLLSGGARQTSASQTWTTPPSGLSSAESMLKRAW